VFKEVSEEKIIEKKADLFDAFWAEYPRKASKQNAKKAWDKLAVNDTLLKTILDGLKAQSVSRDWTQDRGKFIPYPATWLNGRRWEDEVMEDTKGIGYATPQEYAPDDPFAP